MAVLASDLVAETRQHLLGGYREELNKLAAAVTTTSQSTITFTYEMGAIKPGAVLSVGLERMYVWATPTETTATVERGWDGTTATTHLINVVCRVNARYDDFAILRALTRELDDLSSPINGLYRVRALDLTATAASSGYDLASVGTVIGSPLAVLVEDSSLREWAPLKRGDWTYSPNADTGDFASGKSIHTLYGTSGQSIRVLYAAPFVNFTTLTDDAQTVAFLPATANDIPPLGAAVRLAGSRPMKRTDLDSQGSTRRAEEVSAQDALISVRGLLSERERRIQAEAARLASEYPRGI